MKLKLTLFFCLFSMVMIMPFRGFTQKNINANKIIAAAKTDSIFKTKKHLRFSFHAQSKEQINTYLTNIISIENVKPNLEVIASANKIQFQQFLLTNIPYQIIEPSANKTLLTMATTTALMANWDRYPTYDVYLQMMAQFQATYPTLCRIDTIMAATPGGHKILVAKISDNVNQQEAEPQFLYSSSMHGDEVTGYVLMLRLMDYLLSNYSTNAQVANLVNNVELWICPSANPDGTYATDDVSIGDDPLSTRGNFNSVDLNRNYPDPRTGDPVGSLGPIQPETYAFMAFADIHNFTMSANFHGGAELTNYPWDTWTSTQKTHADDSWWQLVCKQYVDTARVLLSNYMSSTITSGVTEGGDWYVITGGRQDYMNWFKQCREITIEISNDKTLTASSLPTWWNYNYKSLLNFIQQSLYGVRGIVTDSITGLPLKALVWVNSHDRDSSHVYSILPNGNYHRPIVAGTYSLTVSAPCYKPKTINNVVVTNGSTNTLNFQLVPGMTADFSADTSSVSCNGNVGFTNTASGASSYMWDFGDGTQSTVANPIHPYATNGVYSVKLRIAGSCGADSVVKTNLIHVNLLSPPLVTNDTICNSDSASLSASGSGQLVWFNSLNGGSVIDTGVVFHTPVVNTTTTYYVESQMPSPSQYVGKLDNTGGGANSSALQSLVFNCFTPVKLISVKVYSSAAGNRTIELRDSNSAVLQTITVNVPNGESRVTLNFNIPVGNKMQLGVSGATINLYRNNAGVAFPYTIANLISIYTTTAATTPTAYYYFFYDWEVQGPSCKSQRAPVQAVVKYSPVSDFNYSANINSVSFTNVTSNGTTYLWRFGDGNVSSDINPVHDYAVSGTYDVTLISTNNCGVDSVTTSINTGGVAPLPDFLASDTLINMGDSINFNDLTINTPSGWLWTFTGAIPASSIVQNPTFIKYPSPGLYNVTMEASNTYGSNTLTKTSYIHVIDTSTSVFDLNPLQNLVLYPNPVKEGSFVLRFYLSQPQNINIRLMNALSKEVYSVDKSFSSGEKSMLVQVDNLNSGVYTCLITYNKFVLNRKLIIIKNN